MKFRKLIAMMLTPFICLSVAACASDSNMDSDKELTVWGIRSSVITDYATNDQSLWMAEKTGISVKFVEAPMNGWYSSFQQFVMSGGEADIYLYPFDTMEITMLSSMGTLIPLENLIEEHAPNIKAKLDANPELRKLLVADDGHIYSLPDVSYNSLEVSQKVYVRKDWLNAYTEATGKGTPETTTEFKEMLQYFVANDMNQNGKSDEIGFMGVAGVDAVYYFMGSFVSSNSSGNAYGCYTNDAGELVFAYNTEEFREGLKYINELYEAGLYSSESFTISADDRYAYTSGLPSEARVGVVSGASLSSVVQLSGAAGSLDYDSYVALPPLEGPNGVRTIMSTGSETIGMRCAITSTCEDPVTAIKWLDFAFGEESRLYSVFGGLQGDDWHYEIGNTINGEGQVVVFDKEIPNNHSWMGQGAFYSITEDDIKAMNVEEIGTNNALATYRANLVYRPYIVKNDWPPIVWAGENVDIANEYSELNSLIKTRVTEYYTNAILGKKNLDKDWDAYVSELNDVGVDRFVELAEIYVEIGKQQ